MKKSQWHKPYRIKKKKSPLSFLKSRVWGLSFLIFIFIAGIFYLFLFFPKFQIKGVEISGVKTVSVENLQVLLENKTAHKILFLNSKSIFLTNSGAIKDVILKEGMVLALEPMVSAGTHKIKKSKDRFGFETEDKSLAAHFEHTVVVTKDGCEILTKI